MTHNWRFKQSELAIHRDVTYYIKHETQCFICEKKVENKTRSGVFLTNFEVFYLVMKHCVECLMLLLKQNDFRK